MALTVAYLAVEILTLPDSGWRPVVVAVLGIFHGIHFAGFPIAYAFGGFAIQIVVFTILAFVALRLPPLWRRRAAWGPLVVSAGWFIWRMIVRQ